MNRTSSRLARGVLPGVAVLLLLVVGSACTVVDNRTAGGMHNLAAPYGPDGPIELEILSGQADQVSGGDALLQVKFGSGMLPGQLKVTRNGADVTAAFTAAAQPGVPGRAGDRAVTGLVTGLKPGWNTVEATTGSAGQYHARLRLRDYPSSGPIFSGPKQYPFLCKTEESGLGQPIVDNHEHQGRRVTDVLGRVTGWSRDCAIADRVDYVYKSTRGDFVPLTPGDPRPPDMAKTTLLDGRVVDYVVRRERGSINRFLYAFAMIAPVGAEPDRDPAGPFDDSFWNRRLVMRFDGGVGLGHDQGSLEPQMYLDDRVLSRGYAVLFTTGTHTTVHYNLVLAAETALMAKERFIERHGQPVYTVGLGVSGGAIQQYIFGQSYPGRIIDAAIPEYSYPDMVTQSIAVADCELLERYMDTSGDPKWREWSNRTWLIGFHASETVPNAANHDQPGSDECTKSWRGMTSLVMNPHFAFSYDAELWKQMEPAGIHDKVSWTHWDDAVSIYGAGEDGFGRSPWGNEGVQYGLRALQDGHLSPAEFLDLNANVGTWKESRDMVAEGCPFAPDRCSDPAQWDPWSSRNMRLSPDHGRTPAPRRTPDAGAVVAVESSGTVFHGDIDIPIIDFRVYQEEQLILHNSHQSFAARQRMLNFDGNADNQVIWFVAQPEPQNEIVQKALATMDQWLTNIAAHPERGVAGNKPVDAVDRCFDTNRRDIALGPHVWDGILDEAAPGPCTKAFPVYGTPRTAAGGPIEGGIFACRLISVGDAIAAGAYGGWQPTRTERSRLEAIFPTGVCDYSARP